MRRNRRQASPIIAQMATIMDAIRLFLAREAAGVQVQGLILQTINL
jgi:hypothetical protein